MNINLADLFLFSVRIFIKKKGNILLPFFLMLCFQISVNAQSNISGKPGLIYVPSATETKEGTFSFGVNYNPIDYGFRFNKKNSENIYFINLTLIPRLEINVNLLRINNEKIKGQKGIGDRQIDIKYLILKEKKYQPSLALIISAPFGIDNSLTTNALIATKSFKLGTTFSADFTAGIGSPYYIQRDDNEKSNYNIFQDLKFRKKKELAYAYLSGTIGGLNLHYGQKGGLLFEWDSKHFNVGAYGKLFKKWTVQAGILNFDQVTFGTSYALNLKTLPKRLKKANENQ
ncbi:YjbH domain-containing protein [Dyadobacter sp. CY356]|uniref:YjbH domain-containing protein n=1 Tax=Dyadobacter sp. CY356 TaxID=2906442 RepID=UPI001F280AA8|nr:YjbH domain-containing protein [Dyadobacter sp. CY356]MCF0055151.1 YjbH domain-containing protein [Dyadobacter sp. CY356]